LRHEHINEESQAHAIPESWEPFVKELVHSTKFPQNVVKQFEMQSSLIITQSFCIINNIQLKLTINLVFQTIILRQIDVYNN